MKRENKVVSSKKQKAFFATILAIFIFLLGGFGGFFINRLIKSNTSNTIEELVRIIESVGYVYDEQTFEIKDLNTEQLADAILSALDDYAKYYTPEEYSNLLKKREGRYNNYGVGFYSDKLRIDVCFYNSPAYKAGVRSGDVIIGGRLSLDQEVVPLSNIYEFSDYFRGSSADRTLYLTLYREGEFAEREFSFTLGEYEAVYVSYSDSEKTIHFDENSGNRTQSVSDGIANLPSDVAYIDFISFEGKAVEQFKDALAIMKDSGKTRLILDLRNNGGGKMTLLEEMAASLIYNDGKSNFPIVYEEHKNSTDITYSAKNPCNDFIQKIVVLANEYSASASECLIGALSYYGGEVFSLDQLIVEKNDAGVARTYGKGIMQTTYTLRSGGAFSLTTAKIYWPDQTTCIHGVGIRPTVLENATERGKALIRAIEVLS